MSLRMVAKFALWQPATTQIRARTVHIQQPLAQSNSWLRLQEACSCGSCPGTHHAMSYAGYVEARARDRAMGGMQPAVSLVPAREIQLKPIRRAAVFGLATQRPCTMCCGECLIRQDKACQSLTGTYPDVPQRDYRTFA